jgi:2-amino-4-hydroxy-6-hydroxymethyldihydropteridine diphosphokinase
VVDNNAVFLALGSNQSFGNLQPAEILQLAVTELEKSGIRIIEMSSLYSSDAWPKGNDAPQFYNLVVKVACEIEDPRMLLSLLHRIEEKFGRNRENERHWGARSLDIDIVDFGGLVLNEFDYDDSPVLPHPRAMIRDFVLIPLLEIKADWLHPATKVAGQVYLSQLLANSQLQNNLNVVSS